MSSRFVSRGTLDISTGKTGHPTSTSSTVKSLTILEKDNGDGGSAEQEHLAPTSRSHEVDGRDCDRSVTQDRQEEIKNHDDDEDSEWKAVQWELEAERRRSSEEKIGNDWERERLGAGDDGRSLFEILEANKGACGGCVAFQSCLLSPLFYHCPFLLSHKRLCGSYLSPEVPHEK